jgi:protease-4
MMVGMGKKKRIVLQVRLESEVVEGRAKFGLLGRAPKLELRRVAQTIRRAAGDRRIEGLFLRLNHPQMGWAKADALARAVREFRASGKLSVAFLEGATNVDFMVGSMCKTMVMPPSGTLHLHGLQAEVLFVKDLLEWAGLEAELDSVGEYKSAGEMFVRREMSAAHREEVEELLEDLSEQMTESIGENRSIEPARILEILGGGPYLAEEAKDMGLIDRVHHEDDCESLFEEALGAEISFLSHHRYRVDDGWLKRMVTFRRPRIAVLYVVGVIGSGEDRRSRSPRPVVGARSLCELLRRARESNRVKAIVLRIESPGGTGVASELIWRELEITRKEKPVVVSMGDVAASGGYYIASAANAILAEGKSLTGSIGIVGGKLVARRLLDKLGVHRETVAYPAPSAYLSVFEPFRAAERERLRHHLRYFYEKLFVPRVSQGRRLSEQEVHQVGRGRVWTGRQAMMRGLVDDLGDLNAAIELASRKAGLPPTKKYRTVTYARRAGLRHLFFDLPWGGASSAGDLGTILELAELVSSEEALFLMPTFLRIR